MITKFTLQILNFLVGVLGVEGTLILTLGLYSIVIMIILIYVVYNGRKKSRTGKRRKN